MLIIIYAHWYNHNKSIKRFAIKPIKVRNPPENQEMEELIKIATSPMKKIKKSIFSSETKWLWIKSS